MTPLRVFLSSTHDLADLRDIVADELQRRGLQIVRTESWDAPVDSSLHAHENCLRAARACDILVGLVDATFGDAMRDGTDRSITMGEIETALDAGRRVMVFVRSTVWTAWKQARSGAAASRSTGGGSTLDPRVAAFLGRLTGRPTGNWVFQFDRPNDLLVKLMQQLGSSHLAPSDAAGLAHLGISGARPDSTRVFDEVAGLIDACSRSILMYGYHFGTTLFNVSPRIRARLAQGIHFRLVLFDPESPHAAACAAMKGKGLDGMRAECLSALRAVHDLCREPGRSRSSDAPEPVAAMEVLLSTIPPMFRVYCADRELPSARMLVSPYLDGLHTPEAPLLLLARTDAGLLDRYLRSIDVRTSGPGMTTLAEWLTRHPNHARELDAR